MAGIGPCTIAGQVMEEMGEKGKVIESEKTEDETKEIKRGGKIYVVVKLKENDDQARAREMINDAGIVIEGFRPGVMERLGLGPDDLGDHVIMGRMTGWGQTGPMAQMAGHDINYLGLTGALAAMGHGDRPPMPPLNLVADYGGGTMVLVMGILAVLHARGSTGMGQVIDVAMTEGVIAQMGLTHSMLARGDWHLNRESNLLDGGAPFYRCYETSDGRYMAVGAIEPQFYLQMLSGAGLPADHVDTQYDRALWPARCTEYAAKFAQKTQSEWLTIFDGSDACVTPVLDMSEAPDHPQHRARDSFETREGVMQSAPAPWFKLHK